MPEQRTVLNQHAITSLLYENYNISIKQIVQLTHGSANCFSVSDDMKHYFLKEYQERFTEEKIKSEITLIDYLIKNNYPTAHILQTVTDHFYIQYKSRILVLQEWIEGKTYIDAPLPRHLLMESAELLGRLHLILKDYQLPYEMDKSWVDEFDCEKSELQYDRLLDSVQLQKSDSLYSKIIEDLTFKKKLLHKMSGYARYYDYITYCATHGDYNCLQYLCGEKHINAVIDFSSAATLPVSWEIMRSYVLSSDSCKNGTHLNINDFCDYVKHYMMYFTLSESDLRNMPYVYLFQLARSKYGYKEYIISKTENRNALIQFAFWRTDICREIHQRAEEISERLACLIK